MNLFICLQNSVPLIRYNQQISIDDVVVKKQNEKRENPESNEKSKKKRLSDTVTHIKKDGRSYRSICEVIRCNLTGPTASSVPLTGVVSGCSIKAGIRLTRTLVFLLACKVTMP